MQPSLIVHGGAWKIPDEAVPDCREGCKRALEAGWKILASGGSAMDAVEGAIVVLEDDPTFDAGIGSHLNRDGRVQLDAILMDGATLKAGAVAAVERVRNPIRLARKLLEESEHMMLVGAGAEQFAAEHGVALCSPGELILEREKTAWRRCLEDQHAAEHHLDHTAGTVGAVAFDSQGRLAAGTSTGGTCCKFPGRVGDSPLIGCGCYADGEVGAVSCTGYGEGIMRVVMAKAAVDFLREELRHREPHSGVPRRTPPREDPVGDNTRANGQAAAEAAVRVLAERTHATGGLILLDRTGCPAAAFTTSRMAYGYIGRDGAYVLFP